jgi:dTDP-glucose 4,6-dehydratase
MIRYKNILVTGGAGFIGSNFIRTIFKNSDFDGRIINLDKLTYAGNLESLKDIEIEFLNKNYFFEHADICNFNEIEKIFVKYNIDCVVHFAAESHVDRSIFNPREFIDTNIVGTYSLLENSKKQWKDKQGVRFHHVSTDEVYGSLDEKGYFFEHTSYDPRSPYSASKASSDHIVRAYFHTYNLPITISNCSNNYGPYQFPEKLISLMIISAISNKKLPIYGDGKNIRDWLFVEDHCKAIISILKNGRNGETYNIGGNSEKQNIEVVKTICSILEKNPNDLITFIKDRPGHDRRYAINCDKIKNELGWEPTYSFEEGIKLTISWYLENLDWVKNIQSGEYKHWIEKNYNNR